MGVKWGWSVGVSRLPPVPGKLGSRSHRKRTGVKIEAGKRTSTKMAEVGTWAAKGRGAYPSIEESLYLNLGQAKDFP